MVEFDLPGVAAESLDLDVERNTLTVHAERPARDPALPCNPRAKTSGADHAHHVLPVLRVEVPQW